MTTPFLTFPHRGRSDPFPLGGNKKGGKNEQNLKIIKIQKELYNRREDAKVQS
jgi:hypothetical protein